MLNELPESQLSEKTQEEHRNISWLKTGTKLERILCFAFAASLLVIAVMTIALAFLGYLYSNKTDLKHKSSISPNTVNLLPSESYASSLCLTPGCVKAAAEVLATLNESIDPCSDFYRFACGAWLKKNSIPEDKSAFSTYYEAMDKVNLQIKFLMERNLDGTEPSFVTMTKELYDTCIDLKAIEEAGSEPLKKVLSGLGGWPVVEGRKWNKRKFDWVDTVISLRKLGYNHNILLRLSVIIDYRSNERYIIQLDQPSFGMPDRTYFIHGLNDSVTAAYYKQMVKAATLLGASEVTAEKELFESLEFERALANYSLPREERRNVSKIYNKYTIKELQEMVPQIPWLKYIRSQFDLLMNEIDENESLIVAVPEFVKKFADLISSTEKRVIANYILWRVVDESLPLLSKEWKELDLEYQNVLTGKSREKPRWEQCLNVLRDNLGIALSFYYVRHYFKVETKNEVSELVKYVHKEFLHLLEELDWMDEKTKTHAKAKANNMIFYVGYPEELLNNTAVIEHYQNLNISKDSYFENILKRKKWAKDNAFSKLRKPNIRRDWKKFAHVALVNAFYFAPENSIVLAAGYLQNSFYNSDRPHYMNFATVGSTIGHEITHGFDDNGRQYDKDGNNKNWWNMETDEHFRQKVQCIIDQYSNYTAENGMKLNGVNTQGENIADNGGLKESYRAYQSWVKDNGQEKLLPGLKYNQNQLFWLSAANKWCSKYRPEELKRRIISYYHSPDEFRVTGPMSNLAEFARDFNCPHDSPMNKKQKCEVW